MNELRTNPKKTDLEWKEILGDFEYCPFCGKATKDMTVKDATKNELSCGEHHYGHRYMIPYNREKWKPYKNNT